MKIKIFIKVITICLALGSISYGQNIYCTALRTSQAYEKGIITEERLEELYHLWKDGLNKYFRTSYDTEDPIATYEDFKMIFGLGKNRIQINCPLDNQTNCDEQLQRIAEETGKEPKIYKKILNTEDNLLEFILEDTEPLSTGFIWFLQNYIRCYNLDKVIEDCSLFLARQKEQKKDL